MKKPIIATVIILLFLGLSFSSVVSAFEVDVIGRNPETDNDIDPEGLEDLFAKVNLGTFKIEMKEAGLGADHDEYPFTFDVDTTGLTEPTLEVTVKRKYTLFPMIQPEFDLVFIENRPNHPAYKIVIVFCASGGSKAENYIILTATINKNEVGEFGGTFGLSNSGFNPFPWRDITFYPRFEIYKNRYDPVSNNNFLHVEETSFDVNPTIGREIPIQRIRLLPFLNILRNIFERQFSFL